MAQSPLLVLASGSGASPAACAEFRFVRHGRAAETEAPRAAERPSAPGRVAAVALVTAFYLLLLVAAFAFVLRMWTV